jgi:hypothetical protein
VVSTTIQEMATARAAASVTAIAFE